MTSHYSPIDHSSRQIRLLRFLPNDGHSSLKDNLIRCCLETYEISQCPKFIALSYAWGSNTYFHKILLNGGRFFVRTNLWAALCVLKDIVQLYPNLNPAYMPLIEPNPWEVLWNHFWIDAICINQEDDRERSHQVNMMRDIFCLADSVIAWLGPEYENSRQAMDMLAHPRETRHVPPTLAVERLLSRPYWSRMWVVQEFLLPSRLFLLCGSSCARYVGGYKPWEKLEGSPGSLLYGRRWEWGERTPGSPPITLDQLILRFSTGLCSDPRDRIFALLGLVRTKDEDFAQIAQTALLADYTISTTELYYRTLYHVEPEMKYGSGRFRSDLRSILQIPNTSSYRHYDTLYQVTPREPLHSLSKNHKATTIIDFLLRMLGEHSSKSLDAINEDDLEALYGYIMKKYADFPRHDDPETWCCFEQAIRRALDLWAADLKKFKLQSEESLAYMSSIYGSEIPASFFSELKDDAKSLSYLGAYP